MTQHYTALVFAIACFGSYPLIVRSAGDVGWAGPLILVMASLVPITTLIGYCGPSFSLPGNAWFRLIGGGMLMGIGFLSFMFLLRQPLLPISAVIPLLNVSTAVMATLGGQWFFSGQIPSEQLTKDKCIGLVAAMIAFIYLRPRG